MHTVTLRDRTYSGGTIVETTRTTADTNPISDSYLVQAVPPYSFVEGGRASADLFEISTWTLQGKFRPVEGSLDQIWAYATTALTFQPFVTGTAPIDLTFLTGGMAFYSESQVTLTDLTTMTQVWTLGWAYREDLVRRALVAAGTTTLMTTFDASHLYQLTIFGRTDARDDDQQLATRVTGLQSVPEPSTLLLIGIGVGAALVRRRGR
jgi:hypothetical protein